MYGVPGTQEMHAFLTQDRYIEKEVYVGKSGQQNAIAALQRPFPQCPKAWVKVRQYRRYKSHGSGAGNFIKDVWCGHKMYHVSECKHASEIRKKPGANNWSTVWQNTGLYEGPGVGKGKNINVLWGHAQVLWQKSVRQALGL